MVRPRGVYVSPCACVKGDEPRGRKEREHMRDEIQKPDLLLLHELTELFFGLCDLQKWAKQDGNGMSRPVSWSFIAPHSNSFPERPTAKEEESENKFKTKQGVRRS